MSDNEYKQLIEYIQQNIAQPMIATDTGIEATLQVSELAAKEEIEWALAGGLAMHLYGSPRLTKDVDIIVFKLSFTHAQTSAEFWRQQLRFTDWQV